MGTHIVLELILALTQNFNKIIFKSEKNSFFSKSGKICQFLKNHEKFRFYSPPIYNILRAAWTGQRWHDDQTSQGVKG